MADRSNDPNYRASAELIYEHMRKMQQLCLSVMSDYGKWLVTSLLILHSGAIAALVYKNVPGSPLAGAVVAPFAIGVVLSLITGFVSWVNFALNAEKFESWADHRMLTNDDFWPGDPRKLGTQLTMYGAILVGVASAACWVWGVVAVWYNAN
jgi:hypothetical protein